MNYGTVTRRKFRINQGSVMFIPNDPMLPGFASDETVRHDIRKSCYFLHFIAEFL